MVNEPSDKKLDKLAKEFGLIKKPTFSWSNFKGNCLNKKASPLKKDAQFLN